MHNALGSLNKSLDDLYVVTAETKQVFLVPMGILPFFMLMFITAFEVLVGFLQAYIFTILAAVYIGGAAHPEH